MNARDEFPRTGPPWKVLLVDDRQENLSALEAILADMDEVQPVRASSGQAALRALLKESFAAVLMDVQMPGMDGFETAALIRANPKTACLPILFVTAGMRDTRAVLDGYHHGAVDYLTKPLEPSIVRAKVRVFCELHAHRQAIAQHNARLEALVAERSAALKRTNSALSEERDRYRRLSDMLALATRAARLGVWDFDMETDRLQWDERMHELYGVPPEDFDGTYGAWRRCVHPDDRQRCDEIGRRALTDDRPFELEFRIVRPDGSLRYVEAAGIVLFAESGQPRRMTGVNADITERKEIEQELRDHRDRLLERVAERTASLNAVVEHAAEGIITTDTSGVILSFNLAAERMFGHPAARMIGSNVSLLIPQPHAAGHGGYLRRYLDGGSSTIIGSGREVEAQRADGSRFPVHVAISEVTAGTERRFTAIVHDISRQKALEASLVRAREAADAASAAKGQFLANMSHEIRTPLNAVIGLAHLLLRSDLSPQQAQQVATIDAAANHLHSIISDILDFSKIEAGKLTLESIDFALADVLEGTASLIAQQAAAKDLAVRTEDEGVPAWLRGDPTRLRQALLNFASNAVKFSDRGTIRLRAEMAAPEAGDAGLLVRFVVEDQGTGIAPERLDSLFQPFVQADASISRHYGGTGLGLAITRRLAELMGGGIGVDSEPGRGSTFWFTARLQPGEPGAAGAWRQRGADIEAELRRRCSGMRILLAEDHPINEAVALELLRGIGLEVDVAHDGIEAVELARRERHVLILMDVQMPRSDGLQAARSIRAMPVGPPVPIIAMTANAFDDIRDACQAAGMDDFVAKPVNPAQLFEVLHRWLPVPPEAGVPRSPVPAGAPAQAPGGASLAPEGFEAAEALARLGGNRKLYLRLLERFAIECERGAMAVADGTPQARRCALHDLRATAGAVGASRVLQAVAQLDAALREPAADADVEALACTLCTVLRGTCEAVRIARAPAGVE